MSVKWMSALRNEAIGVKSCESCVALVDLSADGDAKLVLVDFAPTGNVKLRVYSGITQVGESVLTDRPVAIAPFYNEQTSVASLAVASGSSLYIYKNLKPFYRVAVQSTRASDAEQDAWMRARAGSLAPDQLYALLEHLKLELTDRQLSTQALTFLAAKPSLRTAAAIAKLTQKPLVIQTAITCLATMKRHSSDAAAIDVLIVGTESAQIYIFDSQAFVVAAIFRLPGGEVASHLVPIGQFDIDYKLLVGTREGRIYSLKRDQADEVGRSNEEAISPIVEMRSPIVGMCRSGKLLAVGCMDETLHFVSARGRRVARHPIEEPIRAMQPFIYTPKGYFGVLVALRNQIRMYNEHYLLDVVTLKPELDWIKFGGLGREDAALVIGTKEGGIIIELFRRTAKLDETPAVDPPRAPHTLRLNIPKKTKAFVDQAIREREHGAHMQQVYQRDAFLLRLDTARAAAKLATSSKSAAGDKLASLYDLSADVHGLGPAFRILIRLSSANATPSPPLWLNVLHDVLVWKLDNPLLPIGQLPPNAGLTVILEARCLQPDRLEPGELRLQLVRLSDAHSEILVSVLLAMPASEPELLD